MPGYGNTQQIIAVDDDCAMGEAGVCELCGNVSRATLWRRVADGELPPPLKVGKLNLWMKSAVLAALREKQQAAIEAENGGDKLVHGSGGISQPRAE
jgi:predicted DNA-binding transcriptional regulator AlpA